MTDDRAPIERAERGLDHARGGEMAKWSPERRFWAKVDKNGPVPEERPDLGPCWIWRSTQSRGGWGKLRITGSKFVSAPAFAYELVIGPMPPGTEPDHLCRNPPCVNPHHLEPVTHRENMLRGRGVGSENAAKTHCIRGHPFDEENTYRDRDGHRTCRTCVREAQRRRRATA